MVRIKGLDQMGNRRYKRGTKANPMLKTRWSTTALFVIPNLQSNVTQMVDIVAEMGAEDLLVCDDFSCDWGISDDPIDEKIILYLVVANPDSLPEVSSPSGIARISDLISLQFWRSIGTDSGPTEVTPDIMQLGHDVVIKAATGIEDFGGSDDGLSLIIAAHASTTSSVNGVWQASGTKQFKMWQRHQPMAEWAGYEFEEIYSDDE